MQAKKNRRKKKHSLARNILSWMLTIGIAAVIALFISNFVLANASVISGSMENTVMTGDRVLCNRLAYLGGRGPGRFDIIFFKFTEEEEPVNYLKRVIGLPGETVQIRDGKVYIDGAETPLPDHFVNGVPAGNYGPFEVPEEHYFLLGDNRNISFDSKDWNNPYIAREQIIGKAFFTYFPKCKLLTDVDKQASG